MSSFLFVYQLINSEVHELLEENIIFLQQFIFFILFFFIIDGILLVSSIVLDRKLKQELKNEEKWTDYHANNSRSER